jgi:hypothetical protein
MGIVWRRTAITGALVGGLAVLLTAIVLRWPIWVHLVGPAIAVLVASLLAFRPRRGSTNSELYASDGYSDAYLGRGRPTHPPQETREASQIGDGLPRDPLRLAPPDPAEPSAD